MTTTTISKTTISHPVTLSKDDRGVIEKLAEDVHTVLRITSKKGSVRANHFHKHDSHLCYLTKGKIRYVERSSDNPNEKLREYIVTPGQLFYTAPMIAHAMEFLEDSEFFCFTPRSGDSKEYEEDITRINLIEPKKLQ